MAACEVSSIVASIVAAYNSGLEVFKGMKGKKKRSRHKDPTLLQEAVRLETSLQHRPREIRSEYQKNVKELGYRFEIGDSIAHHSLAHTLLVLNSGLINVINSALSTDDVSKQRISQRSLLSLSEIAAADALYALGQLNQRLTASQLRLPPSAPLRGGDGPNTRSREPKRSIKATIEPPSPTTKAKSKQDNLLARGGWVRPCPAARSKSGSSVASSTSARSSKTALPPNHKRSNTSPAVIIIPADSIKPFRNASSEHTRDRSSPALVHPPRSEPTNTLQNINNIPRSHSPELIRPPSMLIVPADYFDSQVDLTPHRPPKIPLHSRPTGIRPRPPSVATFMTASTKIGEIPEHRWPERIDDRKPLPYVIPPPLEAEAVQPAKKRRGFKFWKRQDREGVQAF